MKPPVIHILTGCTAAGKTELALRWAESCGAEIVSCDSLLFYRGMDIGTAKPTPAERARVPHHLIDILEPTGAMDVRRYVELAQAAVGGIAARGRHVLVTGGSGFYLRSFFGPVTDDVPIDPALRVGLEQELAREGLPALVARLEALNRGRLGSLDTRNPRRVLRALERCLASGRTLAELRERFAALPAPFAAHEVRLIEIVRGGDELRRRIEARVRRMLDGGLIDEVRRLRAAGFESNPAAARAIGYRETLAWLDAGAGGSGSLAAAIAHNTWALARKQRTWFRTQLPPHRQLIAAEGAELEAGALFAAGGDRPDGD